LEHPQWVTRVRFSPDGTELISSCADGRLRVWDWKAGKLKSGLLSYPSLLQDFGFTADRHWLVALSADGLELTDWRTKSPAGPLWDLRPSFNLALDIPAGDRRAIVGGFSDYLTGYDLEKMVTPANASAEELVRLAELAAGRRIQSEGGVVPLTGAEWADRWRRLRPD
jgi:WD40 repeat protein